MIETDRLILRPWNENDADALYKYAKDPEVGPIAGWTPHTSAEYSREIIRTVFSAPETYAVVLKTTNEPIGCCGIILPDNTNSSGIQNHTAEIGYWLGVPYWGQGIIPEAVNALVIHCHKTLHINALTIGFYDGNDKSRRVAEKCGFSYHHTEENKLSPLGDLRTEHYYILNLPA